MLTARIAIVGGGLSGLYAAYLLERQGITDYVLLEARASFGGRIESASVAGAAAGVDHYDLGATWFWPEMQPQLDRLIDELGLGRVEQYDSGDTMLERSPNEAPARLRGYPSSPSSTRLTGGMGALIDALRRRLAPARLLGGQRVLRLSAVEGYVVLDAVDADGNTSTHRVGQVLLALPPRLAQASIEFAPPLPPALARQWRDTATWMAPHAKYVAVYATPFWRLQGLSGQGRSARGPLVEIHDASAHGGGAALFGFLGVPAATRKGVAEDVLKTLCRAQLTRLFGAEAATPLAEFIKDWAGQPYTATPADQDGAGGHGGAPPSAVAAGPWRGLLEGIASEWSPQFPGYVAGAVDAASRGVAAWAMRGATAAPAARP
ncbi:amine oxidase [Janthinobacterium sp. BJB412]|nr:amine oxidase [Janthinobacterium sp. BJB412]